MANSEAKAQHVVAIPYPAQGHINPMLQLCQQLVPHGFTFTFVNTHHVHRRLHSATTTIERELDGHAHDPHEEADDHGAHHVNGPTINTHAQQTNGLHGINNGPIRMVFVEGGCAPEKHAHKSTEMEAFKAAQDMKEQVDKRLSDIMREQTVAFLLTDILLGWGNATASKFGLPWVCFWPASAATCAACIYFSDLAEQGKQIAIADEQDGEVPVIDDIPGLPATRLNDLPQVWDGTGKLFDGFLRFFIDAEKACFLLINTFAELEGQALEALSMRFSTLAVGPLLPSRYMSGDGHTCPDRTTIWDADHLSRPSLFREDRACLDWLDRQAPSSVLFISFGSISARTKEQLDELAYGIEASGCPFLWVRKPDSTAAELGRAQHGNGLIVPWAPQLEVLVHPAVGGFITHCGWNSMIESVAMGVPMLCWADTSERMCNQRFAVQFWGCGLDMISDRRRYTQHFDKAVLVGREEIEKSIRCLMFEETGASIRARAAQLRDHAILAFRDSHSNFGHFLPTMQAKGSSLNSELGTVT